MVKWLLVLAFALGGVAALLFGRPAVRQPSVTSLDVGQGDATLLDAGLAVLVDTGIPGSRAVEKAAALGIPVSALFITHLERDHGGDAVSVIRTAHPAAVFWNGRMDASLYEQIRDAAAAAAVPLVALMPGDVLRIGAATYRVLWPDLAYRTSADHNDSSLVLRADLPGFSVLVTGDLPSDAEVHLPADLVDVDVLKAGHHGSKYSSSDAFLAAVSPEVALISVGKENRYGHPALEALARLQASGAEIHRTDEEGSVSVRYKGGAPAVYSVP